MFVYEIGFIFTCSAQKYVRKNPCFTAPKVLKVGRILYDERSLLKQISEAGRCKNKMPNVIKWEESCHKPSADHKTVPSPLASPPPSDDLVPASPYY